MEKDKYPVKVYSEKLVEPLVNDVKDERQKVDVVRDMRLGDDEIYHLIALKQETDFIHDIVLSLIKSSLASVKKLLGTSKNSLIAIICHQYACRTTQHLKWEIFMCLY
ncbi:hypothetical protein OUZ56_018722 [Daphnia magna]|uniref:Uncharacterized protein n=1 Tax=Daphnia magna TaxID=35525 RepID=A0ABQ9Z9T3_9CRUS|nr:hypothetical protein OUZ56_018722 [Daphnia magna]